MSIETLNCCLKVKNSNPSFRRSTAASSGMRKYSTRAVYMQRRCRVKCVKDQCDVCMKADTERKYTTEYAYEEMQCTSSRVTAAINNILVARHASSTTAFTRQPINNENSSVKKKMSIPARTWTTKALMSRLL